MIEGYKGDPTDDQELFNYIWDFITKQGCKSIDADNKCKYRASKDDKTICCAAGCLIPDEDYNPKWEGLGVQSCSLVLEYFAIRNYNTTLLYKCQRAHDNVEENEIFITSFQTSMRDIARDYNLKCRDLI